MLLRHPGWGVVMATPVLDLRPGDQVPHLGGWFTLAARPTLSRSGATILLRFVGGSCASLPWLARLATRKEGL